MVLRNQRVGAIGSRAISSWLETQLEVIGAQIVRQNNVLVTGGAPGSDQAFIRGALRAASHPNKVKVYLPWPKYEEISLALLPPYTKECTRVYRQEAEDLVSYYYGRPFETLRQSVQKLMLRNYDIVTDASYVTAFCRVKEGRAVGGTAFGIWLAQKLHKPIRAFDIDCFERLADKWDLCSKCGCHQSLWDCGAPFHRLKPYSGGESLQSDPLSVTKGGP